MDIICRKLANDMIYAYHAGRFWRWDDAQRSWHESHLMAAKFERARAALKTLTPESFFSDGAEFALLDEYEISLDMAEALRIAKPCKNAPIDPVEEESSSDAPAACICSTCTCGGCKEECFGNCHSCGHPVQECNSYQTEGEKHLTPAHSEDVAEPFGNIPAAPTFDFSALGDLSQQAADADQQFDLHYGAAQDEYLISCIYLARIHALTAKAGRYGGGTWTKWYESKGLSEGSARTMVKNGDAFNSATVAELKQLPELTRKDLNLIARSGCAGQLVETAGDSQRVQELLAQLKAEKERADTAEAERDKARADQLSTAKDCNRLGLKAEQEKARADKAEGERDEWKAEAKKRGLDCETSTPLIFDRYLDRESLKMFGDMGVFTKVELEARTEVKWETYTKKIQIEGRVLGDLAMNHIVPIASKYEAQLLDKVYKMHQIGGLNASSDILLIKKIQDHTASIQKLTGEMIDARKVANRIEDPREKAIAYHDTVAVCFDEIRRHIDKLEEIVDDQIWPLPKYRELLFLR